MGLGVLQLFWRSVLPLPGVAPAAPAPAGQRDGRRGMTAEGSR